MKIFISYSWDSESHKKWVLKLANSLTRSGLHVFLDQYDLNAGKNMTLFMEESIKDSDKVLVILTPNYKIKAEKREGGVGFEYSICTQNLYETQSTNIKFIPILRKGTFEESVPSFLKVFVYHDMTYDEDFRVSLENLKKIIRNKPQIIRPKQNLPSISLNTQDGFHKFNQMIKDSVLNMENKLKNEAIYSIATGFLEIDRITSGLQDGNLIIVGGKSGMGKTSFALSLINNIAIESNKKVGFFTLELSELNVTNRLLSIVTKVPFNKLSNGKLTETEWQLLDKTVEKIVDSDIFTFDKPFSDLLDLKNKLTTLYESHKVDLIIIDSLQDAYFNERSLNSNEIESFLLILKDIAKYYNIPVVITCNINRSAKMNYNSMGPKIIELPNHEILERLSDVILFIDRPEVYGVLEDEDGNSTRNIAGISIVKNRFGLAGYCWLKFNKDYGCFENIVPVSLDSMFDHFNKDESIF